VKDLPPLSRWLVRALVDGRLPRWLARRVFGRVTDERAWAVAYHELRTAERGLNGGVALSAHQVAAIRARVLGGDAAAAAPSRAPAFLPAALALASLAVFMMVRGPAAVGADGNDLVARGAAPVLGVHVVCIGTDRTRPYSEANLGDAKPMQCLAEGALAFSVTNTSSSDRWLAIAVDGAGAPVAIPFEQQEPIVVKAGVAGQWVLRTLPLAGLAGRALVVRAALASSVVQHAGVAAAVPPDAPALEVFVAGAP
jgi:hypothetical protein